MLSTRSKGKGIINMLTFYSASNKKVKKQHSSTLERSIGVSELENLILLKKYFNRNFFFYKFQPKLAIAGRSMNSECLLIRKLFVLLIPVLVSYLAMRLSEFHSFYSLTAFCAAVISILLHLRIVVHGNIHSRIIGLLAGPFCLGDLKITSFYPPHSLSVLDYF